MSRWSVGSRDFLALTLAAASWGLGTVISKWALEEIPPLVLLPIQLGASLVVLTLLLHRQGLRFGVGDAAPLLGRLGILNPGLAYALSLFGLVSISASLSVLLWALEPLMILVLAGLVLRERFGPSLVTLSLVAATGVILVVYDPGTRGQWPGVALTLAGVGCCAIYTVIARRWIGTSDSTVQVVATQQAYALAFAVAVAIGGTVLGGGTQLGTISPGAWLSAVVSGVLYYAAAYWLYLSALRGVPASFAAVSFYLIPVFGVAGGLVLLHEQLDGRQWIGIAVVVVAVLAIARLSVARRAFAPKQLRRQ